MYFLRELHQKELNQNNPDSLNGLLALRLVAFDIICHCHLDHIFTCMFEKWFTGWRPDITYFSKKVIHIFLIFGADYIMRPIMSSLMICSNWEILQNWTATGSFLWKPDKKNLQFNRWCYLSTRQFAPHLLCHWEFTQECNICYQSIGLTSIASNLIKMLNPLSNRDTWG